VKVESAFVELDESSLSGGHAWLDIPLGADQVVTIFLPARIVTAWLTETREFIRRENL
jgi:hypothetical protein